MNLSHELRYVGKQIRDDNQMTSTVFSVPTSPRREYTTQWATMLHVLANVRDATTELL